MDIKENCIDWVNGDHTVSASLNQRKLINRVKKLAKLHPEEVEYVRNKDGSIMCHFPLEYLRITRPAHRDIPPEQAKTAGERFAEYRRIQKEKKKNGTV